MIFGMIKSLIFMHLKTSSMVIFHFVKNPNVARIARLFFDEESLFVLVVHVSNLWNHFSAHDKYYVPNNFYHEWVFPLNFFEPRVERAEQESLPWSPFIFLSSLPES